MREAISVSSIALAIKGLYESIKSRCLANLTIHNIPVEIQLPPYLDSLIHADEDLDFNDIVQDSEGTDGTLLGRELSVAWRLPGLAPWKSLLLLSEHEGHDWMDLYDSIHSSHVQDESKILAEQLIKLLEMADVTLS